MTEFGYINDRRDACFPCCVATILQKPELSFTLPLANGAAWLERVNVALSYQGEAWVSVIPDASLPWADGPWIAGLELDTGGHAVVAIGNQVAFDPADWLEPGDPLPDVAEGFLVFPFPRALRQHRISRVIQLAHGQPIHGDS